MTRWDTVDSTTTTQRGDDSTRLTRWSWLDEVDLTRRWLDEARCADEDYSMSHGKGYLNLVVRVVDNWKGHLFCEIFFSSILNVKFLLKLWPFIQFLFGCFILLINPLFWNTKVSYHFHLHNYCCGATAGSEQQHNQDLKEIYIGATNSRIHHFLPQCIAFNQSALRQEQVK